MITPPNFDIDTKNDALENVSPFKHGYDLGICVDFTIGVRTYFGETSCIF